MSSEAYRAPEIPGGGDYSTSPQGLPPTSSAGFQPMQNAGGFDDLSRPVTYLCGDCDVRDLPGGSTRGHPGILKLILTVWVN